MNRTCGVDFLEYMCEQHKQTIKQLVFVLLGHSSEKRNTMESLLDKNNEIFDQLDQLVLETMGKMRTFVQKGEQLAMEQAALIYSPERKRANHSERAISQLKMWSAKERVMEKNFLDSKKAPGMYCAYLSRMRNCLISVVKAATPPSEFLSIPKISILPVKLNEQSVPLLSYAFIRLSYPVPSRTRQYPARPSFKIGTPTRNQTGLSAPHGVAIHPVTNDVYVTSYLTHQVKRYSEDGNYISEFGSRGTGPKKFGCTHGISFTPCGKYLLVTDSDTSQIQMIDPFTYEHIRTLTKEKGSAPLSFNTPQYIAFDTDGFMYVSDVFNKRVQKMTLDGKFIQFIGEAQSPHPVGGADGIMVSEYNQLYVMPNEGNRVFVYDTNGKFQRHIEVDRISCWNHLYPGHDGGLLVADKDGDKVRYYDKNASKVFELRVGGPRAAIFDYKERLLVCSGYENCILVYEPV